MSATYKDPEKALDIAITQRLGTRADAGTWPLVGTGRLDTAKGFIEVNYIDVTDFSQKELQGYEITAHFDAWGENVYRSDISTALINVKNSITTTNMTTYSPLSVTGFGVGNHIYDGMRTGLPVSKEGQQHGQLRIIFKLTEAI